MQYLQDDYLIVVSPLQRCLQTLEYSIGIDSLKSINQQGRLVIHPLIREHLEESCDIGSFKDELQHKYEWGNFDLIEDNSFWFLHQNQVESILKIENVKTTKESMWNIIKNCFETELQLMDRIQRTKDYISEKSKHHKVILLFGHANFFHRFTGREVIDPEDNEIEYFGQWLDNGEIYPLNLEE